MSRRRIILFGSGIAMAIAGIALVSLSLRSADESPSAAREASTIETASTPEPFRDTNAAPSSPRAAASSAAAFRPRESEEPATGEGRIHGKATLPENGPRGLPIAIALHSIESDDTAIKNVVFVNETNAAADGSYEFTELADGRYLLFATAPGYTMHAYGYVEDEQRDDEVNLALVPGGNISGRVVNVEGNPVEGARVFNAGWDIQGQKRAAPKDRALASQRTTDAEGRFTLENFRASVGGEPGYQLAVLADGYAMLVSDYFPAGTQGVELVLRPGQAVGGILIHAQSGDPLADKTIVLKSEVEVGTLETQTDAGGYFFLTDVPPGARAADLRDEELVIIPETGKFTVAAGAPTPEVVLQATPGARVSGRLYDADTGQGIGGVEVYVQPRENQPQRRPNAKSGSDGTYSFKGLGGGMWEVSTRKPDGYPDARSGQNERTVSLRIGEDMAGVDFPFSAGLRITGRTVDEDGKPIAGANVSGQSMNGGVYDYVDSGADGSFALAGFALADQVQISARKDGYAAQAVEPDGQMITLDESGASGIRVVFGPESTLSGTVVDTSGKPKGNVDVIARAKDNNVGGYSSQATSAPDGSIKLTRLGEGEHYFIFPRNGGWTDNGGRGAQHFTIKKGQHLEGVKIIYDGGSAGTLTITGRVTNTRGEPIASAQINVNGRNTWGNETRTGADGRYTVTGLAEGSYSLMANSYAHSAAPAITAQAGATNVDFVLKGLATVEGRVINAANGGPVTDFRIRYLGGGQQYYVRNQFVSVRDAEGRFKLTNVEDGANNLDVRAEGYADTLSPLTGVVGGEAKSNIIVRMNAGAELTGRVLGPAGDGLAGAQLFLGVLPEAWQRNEAVRAVAGPGGEYRITSLPSGEVTIAASHAKYADKVVTTRVLPGTANRLDIYLSHGGTIEGLVTLNGEPLEGQHLGANYSDGAGNLSARTDKNGRYSIVGLRSGSVTVYASARRDDYQSSKHQQVEVEDGFIDRVDFEFVVGSSEVSGVVYEAPGAPVREEVFVNAQLSSPEGGIESYHAPVGKDGIYRIAGLPAGTLRISVYANTGRKSVSVEVGERERIQKDIHLYGGATIHLTVSGAIRPENSQLLSYLFADNVNISELSMQAIQSAGAIVGFGQFQNGVATIPNVEPGTYTALVAAFDPSQAQAGTDFLAGAQWTTIRIEAPQEREYSVRVSL